MKKTRCEYFLFSFLTTRLWFLPYSPFIEPLNPIEIRIFRINFPCNALFSALNCAFFFLFHLPVCPGGEWRKEPQTTNRDPLEKKGKDLKITQRGYLPAVAGPMTQLEGERKSARVISRTFIQLRPAGDITGNHQLVGIKGTCKEDGNEGRAEMGKCLTPGTAQNTWRVRAGRGCLLQ